MFKLLLTPFGWFPIVAGIAIAAMICFFQVNSAWADKKQPQRNRLLTLIGVVLALGACLLLWFFVIRPAGAAGGYKGTP